MAFTSTCVISGTVWDGPSGCPIISPSNWQTYVLNNLCVLALHDHSGSAGEGIIFSASNFPAIDNDYFTAFFPTASTNWNITVDTGNYLNGYVLSTGSGNPISYDVYMRSGTYLLKILTITNASQGILTACLNKISIGTMDLYSGAQVANTTASLSFAASGAGTRQLTFVVSTKNALSEDFVSRITAIYLRRTGD